MTGEKNVPQLIKIHPRGIVQRASTSIIYAGDEALENAIRYIHNHAYQRIDVNDVVKSVTVSRRTLETRFKKEIGRTIYDQIRHTQLKRAKRLLKKNDWSIARIAHESGFTDRGRLHAAFNNMVGVTPADYRNLRYP